MRVRLNISCQPDEPPDSLLDRLAELQDQVDWWKERVDHLSAEVTRLRVAAGEIEPDEVTT